MTTHLTPDELSEIDAAIRWSGRPAELSEKLRAHIAQLERELRDLTIERAAHESANDEIIAMLGLGGFGPAKRDEWARQLGALHDRMQPLADDASGPHPTEPCEKLLTLIEVALRERQARCVQLERDLAEAQRKLEHANKCGLEYRQELDKLRDIHQGSVRHRTELADANSELRVHAAQLVRDLDDANATIAAMPFTDRGEPGVAWSVVERWKTDFYAQQGRAEKAERALADANTTIAAREQALVALASEMRARATQFDSCGNADKTSQYNYAAQCIRASLVKLGHELTTGEPSVPATPTIAALRERATGDVLGGEDAKEFLLANPGRRVRNQEHLDQVYEAVDGEIMTVGKWAEYGSNNDFRNGYHVRMFYIVEPAVDVPPSATPTPADALGVRVEERLARLEKAVRLLSTPDSSGFYHTADRTDAAHLALVLRSDGEP